MGWRLRLRSKGVNAFEAEPRRPERLEIAGKWRMQRQQAFSNGLRGVVGPRDPGAVPPRRLIEGMQSQPESQPSRRPDSAGSGEKRDGCGRESGRHRGDLVGTGNDPAQSPARVGPSTNSAPRFLRRCNDQLQVTSAAAAGFPGAEPEVSAMGSDGQRVETPPVHICSSTSTPRASSPRRSTRAVTSHK
jgi:hypothetical protein